MINHDGSRTSTVKRSQYTLPRQPAPQLSTCAQSLRYHLWLQPEKQNGRVFEEKTDSVRHRNERNKSNQDRNGINFGAVKERACITRLIYRVQLQGNKKGCDFSDQ